MPCPKDVRAVFGLTGPRGTPRDVLEFGLNIVREREALRESFERVTAKDERVARATAQLLDVLPPRAHDAYASSASEFTIQAWFKAPATDRALSSVLHAQTNFPEASCTTNSPSGSRSTEKSNSQSAVSTTSRGLMIQLPGALTASGARHATP